MKLIARMVRMAWLTAVVAVLLGVSAQGAAAATLQCGDTVTQNTVVDNDIACPNADDIGLIIGADNITVQFAHHTLQGPSVAGGGSIGITDDGISHTGVTIRGGTVSGFETGVYVQADSSAVKGMSIDASDNGIFFLGDDNYMFHNTVNVPGALGLDVEGQDNYLWGNLVQGTPDDGIVVNGENPLVVLNQVDGCDFNGITAGGYLTAKIARNQVSQCDAGIVIMGANAKLQTNTVFGNADGLFIADASSLVRFNSSDENSGSGIVTGIAGATLTQNSTNGNGDYGIDAVLGTIDGGGNTASGNVTGGCVVVVCTPQP